MSDKTRNAKRYFFENIQDLGSNLLLNSFKYLAASSKLLKVLTESETFFKKYSENKK